MNRKLYTYFPEKPNEDSCEIEEEPGESSLLLRPSQFQGEDPNSVKAFLLAGIAQFYALFARIAADRNTCHRYLSYTTTPVPIAVIITLLCLPNAVIAIDLNLKIRLHLFFVALCHFTSLAVPVRQRRDLEFCHCDTESLE